MENGPPEPYRVAFTLGSRNLFSVRRDVAVLSFSLTDLLSDRLPDIPSLSALDGLRVLSASPAAETRLRQAMPDFLVGARQDYDRSFIDMSGSYEDYFAQFSSKTRSTLRRKLRKFEQASGGTLDLRAYRTPEEMARFAALAVPLSQRTYQARLLDAGLPDSTEALAAMQRLAAADKLRAFLLFLDGEAVAYLYLPVTGATLVYAYLGHDPDHGKLSPGTVLQLAALETLFAEGQFRYFDFTEGTGDHKRLFSTGSVKCASFLMLRPTLANRALLRANALFDSAVASARTLAERTGTAALLRRRLRG